MKAPSLKYTKTDRYISGFVVETKISEPPKLDGKKVAASGSIMVYSYFLEKKQENIPEKKPGDPKPAPNAKKFDLGVWRTTCKTQMEMVIKKCTQKDMGENKDLPSLHGGYVEQKSGEGIMDVFGFDIRWQHT